MKSIGKNAFGSSEAVLEIGTATPPTLSSEAFPYVEYLSDLNVIVPTAAAETAYRKAAVWQEMTFANQNNISEVTVETPGDLSFELITQCNMMPAKVVGLKVNGTINADDFTQMLVNMKLVLPNRLQSIGASAFAGTKINGLVIPDGVTSIGESAFADTPIEGHVTIPDGITDLGAWAFRNTLISTVFLPNSIETLSEGLFQNCQNLNLVYVPDNYTGLAGSAFDGCGVLTTLRLSANLNTMGDYALQNTPLEYVKVPSQVETLSRGVLKNCTKLESLTPPANMTSVESEALYGCTALHNLSVEATTPPVIRDRSAIRGINTDLCLISIPTSAYRAYVLAEYWG